MRSGQVKKVRAPSKRSILIARDVAAIDRVQAGGTWDDKGQLASLWAWLPVSCPRTKGNSKQAFVGKMRDGRTFARVATPDGEEEHQAALVALLDRALVTVLCKRAAREIPREVGSPIADHLPGWTDARRSLTVVLPLPRSGVAETPRPSRKATLLIAAEPRRQPKVGDYGGYLKMIDDALAGAGWVDDDVALARIGPGGVVWVGASAWTVSHGTCALTEPGYFVEVDRADWLDRRIEGPRKCACGDMARIDSTMCDACIRAGVPG